MKSLIEIQQRYIDTVNAGEARWSHRPGHGHAARIARGAWRRGERDLTRLGYTAPQVRQALADARDMAQLERLAG